MQALFHRGIGIEPGTGLATLTVGTQWCYIEHVEDTAFFVSRIRILPEETVELVLAGGRTEPLDPSTVTRRGETDIYVRLQDGHRARLLRDAMNGLGPLMDVVDDEYGLRVAGRFFAFATQSAGE